MNLTDILKALCGNKSKNVFHPDKDLMPAVFGRMITVF